MASDASDTLLDPPEPRWPALIAVLAVGGIYLALPASLAVGPRWLEPAIVLVLTVPTFITHRRGHHELNQLLGHALAGVITLFMVWSLVLLVLALPARKETPVNLLRSAARCGSPMCLFSPTGIGGSMQVGRMGGTCRSVIPREHSSFRR